MKLDICFSPALVPYYDIKNTIAVIVDIFRATTSICAAFENGATSVKTVAGLEEAMDLQKRGYLVAAERNTQKCDFADFGNSPFDFTKELVEGKQIIFTTTNGTRAVESALQASEIIIGAFSNISAVENYCRNNDKNVLVVCSGWNHHFCMEDTLFAGALIEKLMADNRFELNSDAVFASLKLWNEAKNNLLATIKETEHYQRLVINNLTDSVDYCLQQNTTQKIPVYSKENAHFIAV